MRRFLANALTWGSHSWLRPFIKAAMTAGVPPLSLIFEQPERKRTFWDDRIIKAEALLDQYEMDGIPQFMDEDENMDIIIRTHVSRTKAKLERAQAEDEKRRTNKKTHEIRPAYGQSFYPVLKVKEGRRRQTLEQWLKKPQSGGKAAVTGSDARLGVGADEAKMAEFRARRAENAGKVD